jgi:hypothetical protein
MEVASADFRQKMTLERQDNGLFRFTEWTLIEDDEFFGNYWSTTHVSGIYQTVIEAERDARKTLPWLRGSGTD